MMLAEPDALEAERIGLARQGDDGAILVGDRLAGQGLAGEDAEAEINAGVTQGPLRLL
jgi:hypothetical protein